MPTLNWIGKEKVMTHHHDVPFHVLNHKYGFDSSKPGDSSFTGSGNMIIHGDNLTALKSLLPKYEGRIKCIYIDPPYNTGNEKWIYNDNVNDPRIKKWLGEVVGPQGEDLSRHDKWLCMMYPRLCLLRQLLSDDGVIFVSINYLYESSNLRFLLDEIFGPSNYIGTLTWESTTQPTNAGSARFNLQNKVEPILFYCKNKSRLSRFILEEIDTGLKYPHQGRFGACRFEIIEKSDAGGYKRDTMKFPILGQLPREGKRWQIGIGTARELENAGKVEIVDGLVKKAVYPEDEEEKRKYVPFWSHFTAKEVGTAQSGKDLLNAILGYPAGFDTVKPPNLIETLLSHFDKNAVVLDSFAGSGTTAHAVPERNKKDGGNRRFIMVELMDYAETITAQRIKNVILGYDGIEGLGGAFDYYELGQPLFTSENRLNESVGEEKIREYIYYSETKNPLTRPHQEGEYILDTFNNVGYYFYYKSNEATVLSIDTLSIVTEEAESYVIYADICNLSESYMAKHNIVFKQIPRDIKQF